MENINEEQLPDNGVYQAYGTAPKSAPEPGPETREQTRGEKLVGLDFNPSGDNRVHAVKVAAAEMADAVLDALDADPGAGPMKRLIAETALMAVLQAQMAVVKLLTFKW